MPDSVLRSEVVHRAGLLLLASNVFTTFAWVIILAVFVPFAVLYMRQPLRLDYLRAALCLLGAVYFIFRAPSA